SAGLAIIISAFFGTEGVVAIENLNLSSVVIFGIAVILLRWKNLNPVTVMILSGVMEVIFTTTLKFMQ
ncbi:MAG: chromate transporter, partial [Clostridium sp.]